MVKKLLLFTPILLLLLLPTNTYAQTYQLNFNVFENAAANFSSNIQCNSNLCVVYQVPLYNYTMNYEWGSYDSPTCSSTAVVTGTLYSDNTSMGVNNDDFPWARVYIVPSAGGQQYNCSFSVSDNGTSYVCTAPSLASNFRIGFTLNDASSTIPGPVASAIIRSVDINCDTSTGQIIENNNQNTQNIINNNTQNSQNIIDNQNQNTQDIIDNQNSNSQAEIESQKVCETIDKEDISDDHSYISNAGIITSDASSINEGVTGFINIFGSTIKILNKNNNSNHRYAFYDKNKEYITGSATPTGNLTDGSYITIPANAYYFRATIFKTTNKPSYEICKNGNQALSDDINNLNDTLNSETSPDTDDYLEDFQDSLASDTPITNLLTLPLTLINAYNTGITANCSSVNLGNLYGTNLVLPCINLEQLLGSTLWYTIDSLCSIFLIYSIAMLFVHAFDNFTSLKDDFDGMYVPRHAGKHVGSGVDG